MFPLDYAMRARERSRSVYPAYCPMSNYKETIEMASEPAVNPARRTCAAYGDHAYGNPLTDLSKRIQRR